MDQKFKKKIQDWQNRLLDTSRRNPLINFRRPKRTSIKVIDELPTEVYRQLILKNEKFTFDSTTIDEDSNEEPQEHESKEFKSYNKEDLKDEHTDNNLQTNLDDENLFRNLKAIQYKAQDILEVQGNQCIHRLCAPAFIKDGSTTRMESARSTNNRRICTQGTENAFAP